MDHGFHTRSFQNGETFVRKFNTIVDFVKIVSQQFVPELPWGAINRPGFAGLFIKPDT